MKLFYAAVIMLGMACLAGAQEISNPLVKKLYEKGILTKEEALRMDEELAREEMGKTTKTGEKEEEGKKVLGLFEKIKLEGLDYMGYTYRDNEKGNDTGDFELRRGYFVTKAYFNDTDFLRMTLDLTYSDHMDDPNEGDELDLKVKHLYLFLDVSKFLPCSGVEFGLVHTPWLDYEEHSGWWYRSVEKTFYEAHDAADMLPSADLGIDIHTHTEYVSAEYGIFNGEGYDHIGRDDMGDDTRAFHNSLEGRLTFHLLGGGRHKTRPRKDTYLNLSFHGMDNVHHRGADDDLKIYQAHAVFNMPQALVAAQYVKGDWIKGNVKNGDGYSFNAEFRPLKDWALFGRYDYWEPKDSPGGWDERNLYIYGIAWTMNRHLRWILNGITTDYDGGSDPGSMEYNKIMITAEVRW